MGGIRTIMVCAAAIAAGTAFSAATASDLGYVTTVTNTDVATFSIGQMRDAGTGTLNVSGLSGTVTKAYLFWHGPTNSTDPTVNANVDFGGQSVTGSSQGLSQDNFWNYANSQAYRADVTSIVTGNNSYALSNFIKANPTGGPATANINGAQLVVFYDDGNATNNHDVVLFGGNDSNYNNAYDANGWNATLNGVNYAGGTALLTLGVSDGQYFFTGDDGTLTFNGTTIGSGNDFDGTTSQLGDGNANLGGSLWDVRSFDVTSLMNNGTNTVFETTFSSNAGDALSLVTAMFTLPVGAAPPPPMSDAPESATWAMFIGGFGLVGAGMRRSRKTAVRFG